jgi:hypothetical protein
MIMTWKQFLESKESLEKVREKPGGSNVGKDRETSSAGEGPFCGPSGDSPKGSFPVTNPGQVRAAKAYSINAPNPEGIKKCADKIAKSKGWS